MKKYFKIISLVLAMTLVLAMFAGCSKKEKEQTPDQTQTITQEETTTTQEPTTATTSADTLEGYLAANKTTANEINKMAEQNKMKIEIVGNTLTYIYDFEEAMGLDKDAALSSEVKEQLEQGLDDQTSTFQGVCNTLESATNIKGIKVVVKYTHGSDIIAEREFYAN